MFKANLLGIHRLPERVFVFDLPPVLCFDPPHALVGARWVPFFVETRDENTRPNVFGAAPDVVVSFVRRGVIGKRSKPRRKSVAPAASQILVPCRELDHLV
jgi:hypothetical protein